MLKNSINPTVEIAIKCNRINIILVRMVDYFFDENSGRIRIELTKKVSTTSPPRTNINNNFSSSDNFTSRDFL